MAASTAYACKGGTAAARARTDRSDRSRACRPDRRPDRSGRPHRGDPPKVSWRRVRSRGYSMKATIFTYEFPPNIYGGAGVHAKYIALALAKLIDVEVRTLEEGPIPDLPGLAVRRYRPTLKPIGLPDPKGSKALEVLSFNMNMVSDPVDSEIVHTHTWYTNFAGALAKRTDGAKLVATVPSLEPLPPGKREQLGAGYDLSS